MSKNTPDNLDHSPLVLAVESSCKFGSAALATAPGQLATAALSGPMMHARELFDAIDGLLRQADRRAGQIDQVYISAGPGSFTGLRMAVTMAKMMNLAAGSAVVAVNSLDVVAAGLIDSMAASERIAVAADGGRDAFFVAYYEHRPGHDHNGLLREWHKISDDRLVYAGQLVRELSDASRTILLAGPALERHSRLFERTGIPLADRTLWMPTASCVYRLGRKMAGQGIFADPAVMQPSYVRRPAAAEKCNLRF